MRPTKVIDKIINDFINFAPLFWNHFVWIGNYLIRIFYLTFIWFYIYIASIDSVYQVQDIFGEGDNFVLFPFFLFFLLWAFKIFAILFIWYSRWQRESKNRNIEFRRVSKRRGITLAVEQFLLIYHNFWFGVLFEINKEKRKSNHRKSYQ